MNADYTAVRLALKSLNGRFFGVTFIKADGTIRKMVCRLGVKAYLSGNSTPEEREARRESDEQNGIVRVWTKDGYRSFRIDSIIELRMLGMSFAFEPVIHEAVVEYVAAGSALVKLLDNVWNCKKLKNGKAQIPAEARRVLGARAEQVEAWLLA